jgi:hypothetical protein
VTALGLQRFVPPLLSAVMGACANQLVGRQAFLNQFVGHSDSELVQKLGVPTRTHQTGGVKYLAYAESRLAFAPPLAPCGGPRSWVGAYSAPPP